ncbi:MAG: alpha-amylase [Firmicutes bacterium]|nr:alpha-amylase [Bacillota bacterium]
MGKLRIRSLLVGVLVLALIMVHPAWAGGLTLEEIYANKQGVYYQIFVRAFADGDGDGLGDLRGIINNLDYLEELGVGGLWLTPIHPSPTYHKYDVQDYYDIDEEIGTLADFRELVSQAHDRGIKVIIDLVLNHTSSLHPWFVSAALDPKSPYRDYYIWADEDTNVKASGPWGQRVWHPSGGGHYFGLFWEGMPDLNYDNPLVREEAKAIAKYWLELGVAGFRLDAAMHIFAHSEPARALEWWQEFREYVQEINPQVYLVAEVWDSSRVVAPYFVGFDSNFNFDLANLIILSAKSGMDVGVARVVEGHLERFSQHSDWVIDAPFLTNHDQDRVMSVLNDVDKAKVAASLYLTLPGSPFVYYGEEIGMKGTGSDENKREPFKWYPLSGPGQTTWRTSRFNTGEWQPSVQEQLNDPTSLLNHYKTLINLRMGNEALRIGSLTALDTDNRRVIGFTREWEGEQILVFHNLSPSFQFIELELEESTRWEVLYCGGESRWEQDQHTLKIELSPRSSLFLQ